jgi:N-acetylmuramoyl-L-alanine amidase
VKARRGFSLSLLAALIAFAQTARAATVSSASIHATHGMIELRFAVHGRGPRWRLGGERQQLTIELEDTRLAIPARPLDGQELAPVTTVSAVATDVGNARIMIGVDGKVDYAATLAGNELIVRFARTGTAPKIAAPVLISAPRRRAAYAMAKSPPSAAVVPPASSSFTQTTAEPLRPVAITVPGPRRARPLVVIDPGHGGYDPGTQSAAGGAEKDLALAIASHLQRVLAEAGVDAELTRADDRFLSLAERTGIANRERAALFVSIHLNSSPDTGTSGIESYYLDNTSDRATIRLARMENGAASGSGDHREPNLNYVLTDLRQGDKANEAVALAGMIEAESVAAADRATGIQLLALGARQGPFYVLVGAEMPSVLVECGFLSNPEEARRLSDPRYQEALADGIGAAIVHYFNGDEAVGNL